MTTQQAINIAQNALMRQASELDGSARQQYVDAANKLGDLGGIAPTVIDREEFEAARRDPRVRAILEEARETYAKRLRL